MKTMKWGIIGAMPSEAELLKGQMEDLCEIKIGRLTFWEGLLCGQDAVIAVCGIGKVNAAITAQMMIDRFEVEAIINTGIAGAVHPDLKVLDVVVSRELCYHDYNAGFLQDYPPYIDGIYASESLTEAAVEAFQQIDHGSSCCFAGKIASGDQFIESSEVKNRIVESFHPMCVEMEGAAIGHTCTVNEIPFVIIRTMSDNADEEAADSATNFEEVAARHSASIVIQMLAQTKYGGRHMKRIESFCVNHDKLKPGMYVSRIDGDAVTYDIRMVVPNAGVYLENDGLHTFEHLFATYVRNSADSDNIIYVGPMGCRTGFYFITRDCVSKARAIELVQETCEFIKTFEGEIPGSTRIECGNYLDHSLPKAKDYARQLAQTLEGWTEEKMVYEQ